ncbi:putative wd40 protein [Trichostrongylus colubriformis]|uniref:Wd40 protein n=1 Tax=Trichostrongylus colubriformis TaxID=6319 RepID=A0AAN8ENN6_TRICO
MCDSFLLQKAKSCVCNSIRYVASVVLTSLDGARTSGEGHLVGAARHPFTCLAFSSCGRYIATGESGHQPHVRVWEVRDDVGNFTGQSIRSFPFHSNSIVAVRFVPGSNLLISVGCQHDATICVWDWRSGSKLATGKVTAVVNAIAISPDNTMCVTVGSKHVKYWHLPAGDSPQGAGLQSRSAILADRRSSIFVDVVFLDANRVLSVTEDGALVEFLNKKYVKTYRFDDPNLPLCLAVTKDAVVLGCTNGVIRLYEKDDLKTRGRLPHPAFVGMDPAMASTAESLEVHPKGVRQGTRDTRNIENLRSRYPDVRALCAISSIPESFIATYSDRSMFVFEKGDDMDQWRKLSSSLAHVGAVTAVKRYPSHLPYLPSGSFITAGVDGTVRIWSMDRKKDKACPMPSTNLLSPTLKKIIHVEGDFSSLVEPRGDVGFVPSERVESMTGIRCLTVSPDGKHLVAGSKSGNLHIIDLADPEMNVVEVVSAHELDVQCVEYSDNSRGAPYLFASGGRDRIVHLFRPKEPNYEPCYVIDDHQSALNAIRFAQNHNNDLYLFTCGSDKTIIIWRLVVFTQDAIQFDRENLISAQMGINDLLVPASGGTILASCQDRQLRSYSLSGKLLTTVKGTGGEADLQQGFLGKFCLDPSCTYAASVCSDRHVYVVELRTGKCVAAVTGIGESATDVEFSEDCRRLYVTASNGCIFVWRLSDTLVNRMQMAKATLDTLNSSIANRNTLYSQEAVSQFSFNARFLLEPLRIVLYNVA